MKLSIKAGSASQTINIFIQDSSSTTGAGLTGLVYNSGSLVAYYALPKTAPVSITLVTLAAITTAWTSGGFKEIDATNMPGWYRLDIPNAALVSGRFVNIHLKGATNMAPLPIEIELTGWDNQDTVRAGLTALPNAAAATTGGLPTVDSTNSVKIQTVLKKNQALAKYQFLMTDSTTHNPSTGKTVTVTKSIDGGAYTATTAGTAVEVAYGAYYIDLSSADLGGNVVVFRATASGCDDLFITFTLEP